MEHRVIEVQFDRHSVHAKLSDGRAVSTPLKRYPSLAAATIAQRRNYRLPGDGRYIHWPDLDLDLEAEQLVLGESERMPAPPAIPRRSTRRTQDFHVTYKNRRWRLEQRRPMRTITTFAKKLDAQSEAISLGHLMGAAKVTIHRKDGGITRTIDVRQDDAESGQAHRATK